MSRTTSTAFRSAAFAQDTDEVLISLLTVTHPDLSSPIRISSDPTTRLSADPLTYGTTSRGNTYQFLPFAITLPEDRDDAPPRVQITIDNAALELIPVLRSVTLPPSVAVELVLASAPDVVEVTVPVMLMADITYTAQSISIDLVVDGLNTEPFPAATFTPAAFPALF